MARVLVDDYDQTVHTEEVPVQTWQFAFGPAGAMTTYSLDLTKANYERLVAALEPFTALEGCSEVQSPRQASEPHSGRADARSRHELSAVRKWAAQNGHTVAPKGRISASVLAAYQEAHKDS